LFTAPLCPVCELTFRTAFSSFSVTVYMRYRALTTGFASRALQKLTLWFSSLFTIEVHSVLFPHFSPCASGKDFNVTEYFIYLLHYRSCFWVCIRDGMTLVFSDASFGVQYFRNPDTGTSAILMYTQVHSAVRFSHFLLLTETAQLLLFSSQSLQHALSLSVTVLSSRCSVTVFTTRTALSSQPTHSESSLSPLLHDQIHFS
jgi:hypothetical protein